jgi:hypothetical protein
MPVRTTLNYVDKAVPEPTIYYVEPPAGIPASSVRDDPHEVEIVDCREAGGSFSVDGDGFGFVKLPVDFAGFADDDLVRKQHYPQMAEATERLLGRKVTAVLDHAVRLPAPSGRRMRKSGTLRHPFHSTHCDYTPRSAAQQVRRAMGDEALIWLERRYAFVNFWRPIIGPLRDDPLAVCAPHSVHPDDLIRIRHVYDYDDSEVYGVAYNPAHRWYYMSDMQPDDAICFKLYDSADERQRYVPHSAFSLPDPAQPVLRRESFEIRLMISYE